MTGMLKELSIAELDKLAERYQLMREVVEQVKRDIASRTTEPTIEPNRYAEMSKADAITDYLRRRGEAANLEQIGEALMRGGCDLGGQGLKFVKTTITMNAGTRFVTNGDLVGLKEWRERAA